MGILSCLSVPKKGQFVGAKVVEVLEEEPRQADCSTQTDVPDLSWLKEVRALLALAGPAARPARSSSLQFVLNYILEDWLLGCLCRISRSCMQRGCTSCDSLMALEAIGDRSS
jgi:hypothetical protein